MNSDSRSLDDWKDSAQGDMGKRKSSKTSNILEHVAHCKKGVDNTTFHALPWIVEDIPWFLKANKTKIQSYS